MAEAPLWAWEEESQARGAGGSPEHSELPKVSLTPDAHAFPLPGQEATREDAL